MMTRTARLAALVLFFASGCSESTGGPPPGTAGPETEVTVDVPATGRAFVRLAGPEVVTPPDDGMSSTDWDLAFSGYDIFTNSGLSGPGDGGAFPLDMSDYEAGTAPTIPFLITDEAGGAFSDWYFYDPAEHVIYSRFHVFGVEDGGRTWKVQLYSYYGDVQGAPVAALYQLRYAEVLATGSAPTVELVDLDGTAGGTDPPDTAPSACLDLEGGAPQFLTPAEAAGSTAWRLCFRRSIISVNGELGGPGQVRAADLEAAASDAETLDQIKARTPATEQARFDAVDHAALTDPLIPYRGDHIITAFSDKWIEPGSSPPAPAEIAWLVQAADGVTRYLVAIDHFEGPTDATPGRVTLRVKLTQ